MLEFKGKNIIRGQLCKSIQFYNQSTIQHLTEFEPSMSLWISPEIQPSFEVVHTMLSKADLQSRPSIKLFP